MRRGTLANGRAFTGVACVLATLAAMAPPAQAAYPGVNGKIAYAADGIWTMDPDGAAPTQVTQRQAGSPAHVQPEWSPDGQRIAYVRSSSCACDAIYVVDSDGSDDTFLYQTTAFRGRASPTWSPDGQRIAVSTGGDIWSIGANGANVTQITDTVEYEAEPTWSPSGEEIAFIAGAYDGASTRIDAVRPDGTGRRTILDPGPDLDDDGIPSTDKPDWSPDGSHLVYENIVSSCDSHGIVSVSLDTVRADGGGHTQLTPSCDIYADPSWSPDGARVVFRSHPDPITHISIDGTNAVNTGRIGGGPDWQPIPGPQRSDYKNAAHFCKAEQTFWGGQFASRYGGGANAHGKCVSGK